MGRRIGGRRGRGWGEGKEDEGEEKGGRRTENGDGRAAAF